MRRTARRVRTARPLVQEVTAVGAVNAATARMGWRVLAVPARCVYTPTSVVRGEVGARLVNTAAAVVREIAACRIYATGAMVRRHERISRCVYTAGAVVRGELWPCGVDAPTATVGKVPSHWVYTGAPEKKVGTNVPAAHVICHGNTGLENSVVLQAAGTYDTLVSIRYGDPKTLYARVNSVSVGGFVHDRRWRMVTAVVHRHKFACGSSVGASSLPTVVETGRVIRSRRCRWYAEAGYSTARTSTAL